MNKKLQTKLQNHFQNNDSLTLYKKDGTERIFNKKHSIVFKAKYEAFSFTDYDKFIDFANKHGFTFTANDARETLTLDALLKKLKKHDRVEIYSRKNDQCTVYLAPYIQCKNMVFDMDCIDLCSYYEMTGLSFEKNTTKIAEEK